MKGLPHKFWWVRLATLLTFWVASYFILLTIFETTSGPWLMIDHIYTSIFIVTLLIPVSINDVFLIKRLLNKQKYGIYLLVVALTILVGAGINHMLFSKLIDYILPGYYFISYYEFADLLKFFTAFIMISTLITLSLEWFRLQEDRYRTNKLEKERVSAEFKALASQVNPHFLFNSLTVLYSLAVKNSADTPGAILKLSDILRYVIYQSSATTVSLRSELAILQDFIDLQRYRVNASTQIDLSDSISDDNIQVAPMLMLPLLENSFKHGTTSSAEPSFVKARAIEENGTLHFTIINNKSEKSQNAPGGFGLKNLRERLALAYPGRYSLDISETQSTFAVSMQINLK